MRLRNVLLLPLLMISYLSAMQQTHPQKFDFNFEVLPHDVHQEFAKSLPLKDLAQLMASSTMFRKNLLEVMAEHARSFDLSQDEQKSMLINYLSEVKKRSEEIDRNILVSLDLTGVTDVNLGSMMQTLQDQGLTQYIKKLDVSNMPITNLDSLASLTNLQYLDLSQTLIANLGFLENLSNLEYLDLSGTQVIDLEPLTNLTNLKYLNLLHAKNILDVKFLEHFVSLQYLNLGFTQVSDWKFLKGLINLQYLDLAGTQIPNLEVFKNLTNLKVCSLLGTSISDISVLGNLGNLEILSLAAMQIQSLKPLINLDNLQMLHLTSTQILDDSLQELPKKIRIVE